MPVDGQKIPIIKWTEYKNKQLTESEFENFYHLEKTKLIGIICGFNDLEIVDIDTKVLATVNEKTQFWTEFYSLLKDNIIDFEKKFVIAKTLSGGFHICYKTKVKQGNTKIAKAENTKEALIETRGVGGYVVMYSEFIQGTGYEELKYIDDRDRQILWECAKTYDTVKEDIIHYTKIEKNGFVASHGSPPWEEFNNRFSCYDLVKDEFDIIKKTSKGMTIRRHGAKSPHSGYIFESNLMYLFSTGTQYPHEKALSPFAIYAIQKHNGDFGEAAKQLYKDGYGNRVKPEKLPQIKKHEEIEIKTDEFPIEVFTENIQSYIYDVHQTLNASIDYLGSSFLWVLSLCVGNAIKMEVKKGWIEAAVVWIAIVGKAGIGKTHNIEAMVRPLRKANQREIEIYNEQLQKYNEFMSLTDKEKKTAEEVREPARKQFIVGDITMEAFIDIHAQNKNGIGILRDELSGWIKDLNKYRQGSDLENYLSCWSNIMLNLTRKTARSGYVPHAFVPIIGGVQPSILSMHYTPENKDNGFIDRWLLCFPELNVDKYSESEMSDLIMEWYNDFVLGLYEDVRNNIIDYYDSGSVKPKIARFDYDAKKEWIRIFNKITDMQNSEEENEYMKSILPKQKSYVIRFALLLNTLYAYNGNKSYYTITKDAVLGAEKLSDYFIKMAKKNKFETIETSDIIQTIKASGKILSRDKFIALYEGNRNINRSKVADQLGVSRKTINRWINEYDKK